MKYAAFFVWSGAALAYLGWSVGPPAGLVVAWPVVTSLALAVAYLTDRPSLLGKRSDGRISLRGWLLCGPWFVLSFVVFTVMRLVMKERPFDRIGSLYFGRRLVDGELPAEIKYIVDLTSEFQEVASMRRQADYVAFPILDARAADLSSLSALVERLADGQPTFIHCAQGHGRTGLVAAILLVARGDAKTAEGAVAMLRAARPGIALNNEQRASLNQFVSGYGAVAFPSPGSTNLPRP